jgi:hypothetical protein
MLHSSVVCSGPGGKRGHDSEASDRRRAHEQHAVFPIASGVEGGCATASSLRAEAESASLYFASLLRMPLCIFCLELCQHWRSTLRRVSRTIEHVIQRVVALQDVLVKVALASEAGLKSYAWSCWKAHVTECARTRVLSFQAAVHAQELLKEKCFNTWLMCALTQNYRKVAYNVYFVLENNFLEQVYSSTKAGRKRKLAIHVSATRQP